MSNRLSQLIATFFYLGYFPFASGSLAGMAGGAIAIFLHRVPFLHLIFFAIVTALGFYASDRMEKWMKEKDPSCIVIDEVAGVLIAFFMLPVRPSVVISAFFLFRAFDMFKIYPANKFEEIKGGSGVMMDDIVAGIYTNLVMQIAVRLAGII